MLTDKTGSPTGSSLGGTICVSNGKHFVLCASEQDERPSALRTEVASRSRSPQASFPPLHHPGVPPDQGAASKSYVPLWLRKLQCCLTRADVQVTAGQHRAER